MTRARSLHVHTPRPAGVAMNVPRMSMHLLQVLHLWPRAVAADTNYSHRGLFKLEPPVYSIRRLLCHQRRRHVAHVSPIWQRLRWYHSVKIKELWHGIIGQRISKDKVECQKLCTDTAACTAAFLDHNYNNLGVTMGDMHAETEVCYL